MGTKHTPGPWTIKSSAIGRKVTHSLCRVGEAFPNGDGRIAENVQRPDADGSLLSAAPELLAACKALVQRIQERHKREGSEVIHLVPGMLDFLPYEAAKNAIAKAEAPQ